LKELDLPGEQCVFLDDMGGNLKAAKEFGIKTIKVNSSCLICIGITIYVYPTNFFTLYIFFPIVAEGLPLKVESSELQPLFISG
jgi:hypothetical protein